MLQSASKEKTSVGQKFKWTTITETCSLIIVDRKNENKLKNDVERILISWFLLLLGHPQHLDIIQRRKELQATYKTSVYKKNCLNLILIFS